MKFGAFPIDDALGVILAHAVVTPGKRFPKSHHLTRQDLIVLAEAGVAEVMGARLEDDDVPEDIAAARLAKCIAGPNTNLTKAFTGRCNLIAATNGILEIDEERIKGINKIDESLTIATLPSYSRVVVGQTIATAKIIPFASSEKNLGTAESLSSSSSPIIHLRPFTTKKATLISTTLPETKQSVIDKSAAVLEERLEDCSNELTEHVQCQHALDHLSDEIMAAHQNDAELILIFGASAITDRGDVIPRAIERAGGQVDHLGMPVDPGNLLLLGHKDNVQILGLPGCARSPKLNGFDWVLERLLANVEVTPESIMEMGVGGLLKEIPTRPQPREDIMIKDTPVKIGALILAAGQSRRMGVENKLLQKIDGTFMVKHVAQQVLNAEFDPVMIVTGHESSLVKNALAGLPLLYTENDLYSEGLSTSLAKGVKELSAQVPDLDAIIVCLGDMPQLSAANLRALTEPLAQQEAACILVPTHKGKRGNPVLWSREFFTEISSLKGDAGAKSIIGQYPESLIEVDLGTDAIFVDVDTPEALQKVRDQVSDK